MSPRTAFQEKVGNPRLEEKIERMNSTLLGLLARSKWDITEQQAEWVLLDEQVKHAFTQLVGAITANPWRIDHDNPDVIEFCENVLASVSPGGNAGGTFNQFVRTLMKTVILGHTHLNFVWEKVEDFGGAFLPTRYFRLPNTTIYLDPVTSQLEYQGSTREVISTEDRVEAQRLRRWVLNLAFAGDGHPFGESLARILWWPVSLRRDNGITNWSIGMERFALPGIKGKMSGNPTLAEMNAYKDFLVEWRNQFVAIMGEDDEIEFENTSSSWNPEFMESFVVYMDRIIDKNILGQSGTSGDRGDTGTFAETKVQFMVRADLIEDYSNWLGDVLSGFLNDVITHPDNLAILGSVDPPKFIYQVADGSAEERRKNIRWAFEQGLTLTSEQLYGELELVDPDPVEGGTVQKTAPTPPTGGPFLPFERHSHSHVHLQADGTEKPRTLPEWIVIAGQVHAEEQRRAWKPIDDAILAVLEAIRPNDWKRGIGNETARKIAEAITSEDRQPLVKAIANSTLHGQMLGRHAVDSARTISLSGVQTQRENDEAFLRSIGIFEDMSERGLTDDFFLSVDEMSRIFRDPEIVSDNAWGQAQARSDRWGFWVTGLEEEERIRSVARALDDSIVRGETFQEFQQATTEVLGGFSEARQGTIFRTNLAQASSVGSYARMKDPQVARQVRFWVYSNPNDLRSRVTHALMDGKRFRTTNPIWNFWYYPNGFGCRCDIWTQWTEERKAPTDEDQWPILNGRRIMPDEGFQSNGAAELLEGNFEVMR